MTRGPCPRVRHGNSSQMAELTAREIEILEMVARGLQNKTIAAEFQFVRAHGQDPSSQHNQQIGRSQQDRGCCQIPPLPGAQPIVDEQQPLARLLKAMPIDVWPERSAAWLQAIPTKLKLESRRGRANAIGGVALSVLTKRGFRKCLLRPGERPSLSLSETIGVPVPQSMPISRIAPDDAALARQLRNSRSPCRGIPSRLPRRRTHAQSLPAPKAGDGSRLTSSAPTQRPKVGDPLRISTATSNDRARDHANQLSLRMRGELVVQSAQYSLCRDRVVVLDEIA